MNLQPFAYATAPHRRRHHPAGYRDYRDYKPWLRDECTFRRVYCLEREAWYPDRSASFSVEHVVPRSVAPSRVCDYENLLYACRRCNAAKQDILALDPTEQAFGLHLQVLQDGSIQALTPKGQDLIDLLHLDEDPARQVRRFYLEVLALKAANFEDPEVDRLYLETFGYPADLPDLTRLRPPGGNLRDASERTCHYVLRQQARLDAVY